MQTYTLVPAAGKTAAATLNCGKGLDWLHVYSCKTLFSFATANIHFAGSGKKTASATLNFGKDHE